MCLGVDGKDNNMEILLIVLIIFFFGFYIGMLITHARLVKRLRAVSNREPADWDLVMDEISLK